VPRQFERYRFRDGVTTLGEDTFNRVLSDIDLRLATLEGLQGDCEAALALVSDQGLARVAEAMSGPLADLSESVAALAAQVLAAQQAGMLLDAPGTVTDANIGNRTLSDGSAPGSGTGDLTTLLAGIVNRLKAITGGATWMANPATTLAAVGTAVTASTNHIAALANPHQTTAAQVGALNVAGGTLTGPLVMTAQPVSGVLTLGYSGEIDNGNSGSAKTISLYLGAKQKIALTQSCTLTVDPATAPAGDYLLRIVNGGAYTVTWAGLSGTRWQGASSAPAVLSGSGKETLVSIYWNGSTMTQKMDHVGAT